MKAVREVTGITQEGRIVTIPLDWVGSNKPMSFWPYLMQDCGGVINFVSMNMVSRLGKDGEKMTKCAVRIEVNPDETFNIVDFTLPSLQGRLRTNVPIENVPKWAVDAMAVLQIAEEGNYVKGVGFRVSPRIYYVADMERIDDGEQC